MTTATNAILPSDPLFQEMYELVTASLRGDLSEEAAARLEQLICGDRRACDLYLEQLHASRHVLTWANGSENLAMNSPEPAGVSRRGLDAILAKASPAAPAEIGVASRPFHPSRLFQGIAERIGRRGAYSIFAATAAVALLVTVMAQFYVPQHRPHGAPVNSEQTDAPGAPYAAMLTNVYDCRWGDGREAELTRHDYRTGRRLRGSEEVVLLEGFAEITFRGGSRIVIQGPARFAAESHQRGRLEQGSLVARVPPQAKGFTIATPRFDVVDLGTEFGVRVADDSTGEVQVFAGAVQICPPREGANGAGGDDKGQAPSGPPVAGSELLTAGEAARLAPSATALERLAPPAERQSGEDRPRNDFAQMRMMLNRVASTPPGADETGMQLATFNVPRYVGDEAVLNNGRYERAWNVNGPEITVNGVKFAADAAAPNGTAITLRFGPNMPDEIPPPPNGDADEETLSKLEWADGNFNSLMRTYAASKNDYADREGAQFDVTIGNLKPGTKYRIQFFMGTTMVASQLPVIREMRVVGAGRQSAKFNTIGPDGRHSVVAYFTAQDAEQVFTFDYAGSNQHTGRSVLNAAAVFSLE